MKQPVKSERVYTIGVSISRDIEEIIDEYAREEHMKFSPALRKIVRDWHDCKNKSAPKPAVIE